MPIDRQWACRAIGWRRGHVGRQPMTTGVRHLRMAELSSRSGFSASTIRHYLRLGLLPEPLRTAKTMAYYGPEHVQRLAYIGRRLKDGATLREVGQELAGDGGQD